MRTSDPILRTVVAFVVASLTGVMGGYWLGLQQAEVHDVSMDEAFQAGYMMRDCDGGELFKPLANMTTECQDWFMAFCREHPKTYGDCSSQGVPDGR